MTTELARREQPTGGALAMWNAEQLDIITKLICPDATPAELSLFGQVCQRTGLDPFAKQIYGIKRQGKLTIQTSIDGFRLQAQRSHDYAGQEGPQWCGEDGIWRDVWLSKDVHPAAARVGVYRKGWSRPAWGVSTWNEYAQFYNGKPQGQWGTMPANMLAKCAESQALRKAFPAELSGLYSRDEMAQADNESPVETGPPPTPSGVVDGEVVQPWVSTYHTQWARGAAKAREIGAGIPTKLDPATASKEECQALLQALRQNIEQAEAQKARIALEIEARQVIADTQAAGGRVDVPDDLAEMTDAEIREMIDPLRAALEAQAVPA